jgi:hypothetical protein
MSHKPELLRLSTPELLIRRHSLATRLAGADEVLFGSLVEQLRRCGKANCRCALGDGHGPYMFFTPRRAGRGMKYVPAALVASVRGCLGQGERIEALLTEISSINVELLARRALS